MIQPFISFLLGRIGTMVDDDIRLIRGVSKKISGAQTELLLIHAFLGDADDLVSRNGNNQIRTSVAEIREAAWELEDILMLLCDKASRRWWQWGPVAWVEGVFVKHSAAPRLESVADKLSKCRSVLQENQVQQAPPREPGAGVIYLNSNQVELRRSLSHLSGGDPVFDTAALRDGVKLLVDKLVEPGEGVLSISGMGGIGKTTLARQVYNHPEVRESFRCFAWVQISPDFDQTKVWSAILTKLQRYQERAADFTDDNVARILCETMAGEKCFVVLDDIWPLSTWDRLKHAFPVDYSQSRILLVTRNKEVHPRLGALSTFVHEPRCLTDTESWDFLAAKTNFESITPDLRDREEMMSLGREMLKFCLGLPLAIEVLAGILIEKHTAEEWKPVLRNIKTYLHRGRISEQTRYSGVLWLLNLSYEELPYELKQCFLHLANFVDDFISMKELHQLWMAEDLVASEDQACEFFERLEKRYLVQVVERSLTGEVKKYRIHDLIRDMCAIQANEERFLQINDFQNRHRMVVLQPETKVRRLAIYVDNNTQNNLVGLISKPCPYVRSFVCFDSTNNPYLEPVMKPLFKQFQRLRVLKFENQTAGEIGQLPVEIGELIHLRFLSLRNSHVTDLPSSISKLIHLQTLDLRSNWTVVIPDSMSKLTNLRHLYLPQKIEVRGGKALELEKLTNLRTLVNVRMECCKVNALTQLLDLRKLKMYAWRNNTVSTFNSLESLAVSNDTEVGIPRLISSCPNIVKLCLDLKMNTLPDSLFSCQNLKKLTLRRTNLNLDPMLMLYALPRLMILRIEEDAFLGLRMNGSRNGFPMLESLYITKLKYFSELGLEIGAFPSLRRLHVSMCPSFRTTREEIRRFINSAELFL